MCVCLSFFTLCFHSSDNRVDQFLRSVSDERWWSLSFSRAPFPASFWGVGEMKLFQEDSFSFRVSVCRRSVVHIDPVIKLQNATSQPVKRALFFQINRRSPRNGGCLWSAVLCECGPRCHRFVFPHPNFPGGFCELSQLRVCFPSLSTLCPNKCCDKPFFVILISQLSFDFWINKSRKSTGDTRLELQQDISGCFYHL